MGNIVIAAVNWSVVCLKSAFHRRPDSESGTLSESIEL